MLKDDIIEDMSILEDFESRGEEYFVFCFCWEFKIVGLEVVNYIIFVSFYLGVCGKK